MGPLNVFKALSDQRRLDLVICLGEESQTVDALKKKLKISQSSTSQHLKILQQANLVSCTKHGNFRVYFLKKAELKKAMHFFDKFWDEGLTRLKFNLENE